MILLYLSFLLYSEQRSTPEDNHYVAAVVEYQVSRDVAQNRINYIQIIEQAARQNADIVVFPELTLTNNSVSFSVPIHGLLKEYPIPALHPDVYDELLVSMSAAARENQVYVVLNTRELMDCTRNDTGEECPQLKEYIFNTNVVFDRTGAVIDRYRKINLFGEASHTPALHPDLGVFDTDFGVTFGHFICFDLMFQVPAVQVVQKHGLTDIIFSTMWFSELPYLTAIEIQEAFAYSMGVNFIAAGANNPLVGSAGSGIYSGKAGALVSTMPGQSITRLLVATVPKVPGQNIGAVNPGPIYDSPTDHDNLRLITDPSLPSHVSRLLVPGLQSFTLVDKDVTCRFIVKLSNREGNTVPHFRAVVQDGTTTYSKREIGVAACLVVACKNDDFKSCGYRHANDADAEVDKLEIEMTTYKNSYNSTLQCDNIVYFPLSFIDNKFPLEPANYTYTVKSENNNDVCIKENSFEDIKNEESKMHVFKGKKSNREKIVYKLEKPQKSLVAFGVWGRIYTRDIDHTKTMTEEDLKQFQTMLDIIYSDKDPSVNHREKMNDALA